MICAYCHRRRAGSQLRDVPDAVGKLVLRPVCDTCVPVLDRLLEDTVRGMVAVERACSRAERHGDFKIPTAA